MSSDQIINYENNGGYDPDFIYDTDPEIRQVLMQLINGTFSSDTEMFRDIYNSPYCWKKFGSRSYGR